MKTRPVGAELFRAGGQTEELRDIATLTAALRHFTNVPENAKIKKDNKHITYER